MKINVLSLCGCFILSAWQLVHLINFSIVYWPNRRKLMFHCGILFSLFFEITMKKNPMLGQYSTLNCYSMATLIKEPWGDYWHCVRVFLLVSLHFPFPMYILTTVKLTDSVIHLATSTVVAYCLPLVANTNQLAVSIIYIEITGNVQKYCFNPH